MATGKKKPVAGSNEPATATDKVASHEEGTAVGAQGGNDTGTDDVDGLAEDAGLAQDAVHADGSTADGTALGGAGDESSASDGSPPAGALPTDALEYSFSAVGADQHAPDEHIGDTDLVELLPHVTESIGVEIKESLTFPRLVAIINDQPIARVVAGKYVQGNTVENVLANDADEITRMRSDCEQIVALSDHHSDADVPPLRIAEVD